MNLPFTIEEFLQIFWDYNHAIWPMQIAGYALGIAALFFVYRRRRFSGRIVFFILSFYWLWMGIVYHLIFFSRINKAAYLFGGLFIVQGALFLLMGLLRPQISFLFRPNLYGLTGIIFVIYAMTIYPVLGYFLGHGYPQSPGFGVAPCPTTIFTFGLLLMTQQRFPKYILIIPFAWSIMGFFAALSLGIPEDIGLLVAGVLGTFLIFYRDGKRISKE